MATTTNYSWSTPDDTALVKDGAAAIRSLGTAIDSTVFTNAGAAIAKATVDAKGDLIAGTADNTVARLAVGANDTVLTADSSAATGLKWAAPITGGMTEIGTIDFATATTFTSIPATYVNLFVVVKGFGTTTSDNPRVRFNADTGSNYNRTGIYGNASTNGAESSINASQINLSFQAGVPTSANNIFVMNLFDYKNSTSHKLFSFNEKFNNGGTDYFAFFQGYYKSTSAISSLEFSASSGTLQGSATLYGVK
jgi:hypothetical protein